MDSPSESTIRVLITDGDEETCTCLLEYFQPPAYAPTTVGDADTALRYLSDSPGYDIALLDVCLPDNTGFELLETAQERPIDTAFLFLAHQNCLEDKLRGFQLGADDYVVLPCAMEELEARMHAALRPHSPSPSSSTDDTYTFADLTIRFDANTCFRNDRRVPLTALEFNILEYLVEHRGEVVPREALRDAVWTDRDGICLRTIDRHVAKIREKLEQDDNVPAFLQTVYGKGYQFACAETP